jgi:hypothetical protein
VLAQLRSELCNPDEPGAAFTDLIAAIQDPTTRSNVIQGKADLIDAVLRLEAVEARRRTLPLGTSPVSLVYLFAAGPGAYVVGVRR